MSNYAVLSEFSEFPSKPTCAADGKFNADINDLMAREMASERERARSRSAITGLISEAKNSRRFGALVCPKSIFLQIINLHSAR